MKVAFVVFDGMTVLDFVGIYDCITRLKSMGFMPSLTWEICALSDQVSDDHGLRIASTWTRRRLETTTNARANMTK